MENLYPQVKPIIQHAGDVIMEYYHKGSLIEKKEDGSYLTEADTAANNIIKKGLIQVLDIPFVSEEGEMVDLDQKQGLYRLVDPLDGTQSFVKREGDFNVDIALMKNHKPIFSIIYDPARKTFYSAKKGSGSFKEEDGTITPLLVSNGIKKSFRFINSWPEKYQELKEDVSKIHGSIEEERVFSAFKFCLMAEDKADLFAQIRATHHRDTAAGELIATEAGLQVLSTHNAEIIQGINYNASTTLNDRFLVYKPGTISQDIVETFLLNPTRT